ncbi:branched-chain amino acid ABC transporter permease [Microbacterium sp. ARD32]|uniref:branched-chain amino acid ABC transporter permease n=1 Tax=Microbacterium sp. ARD32 TaxID=2962577 RepID=UPI0028816FEE|nr:branched-chain amino acid ABC transporter permease [Microbacterium sp. ARD32]MDT0156441.1 branched-chain amino acid ABC transporter permease [Microbacterium sp. ARD32]
MIRPRPNRRQVAVTALCGALLIAAVVLPYVATKYYVTVAALILASALLASSVNLLAGNAGLYSLGHAGIAAAAGYGLAWSSRQGMSLTGQLLVALLLTLIASVVYGVISMRTSGVFFLMVTLAAGMVCYGMAYRWSSVTGGDNGLTGIRRPEAISDYWQYYFFVLAVFLVATLATRALSASRFGLSLRGIRDSQSRMRSLGYSVSAYKFAAVVLSGLLAGLAGVLLVWQNEFVSPASSGFQASALALVMVVLGGAGRTLGPLIGATVVVLIQQVLSTYVDRWPTVLGIIFVVVVIVKESDGIPRLRAAAQRLRTDPRRRHSEPTRSTQQY